MAKIKVSYDENTQLTNQYHTARVGIVIESDKEVHNEVEISELTEVLLGIAKSVVKTELEKLKKENGEH